MNLNNTTPVLVSGGASGLGAAVATHFLAQHIPVGVIDLTTDSVPAGAVTATADISDASQVTAGHLSSVQPVCAGYVDA